MKRRNLLLIPLLMFALMFVVQPVESVSFCDVEGTVNNSDGSSVGPGINVTVVLQGGPSGDIVKSALTKDESGSPPCFCDNRFFVSFVGDIECSGNEDLNASASNGTHFGRNDTVDSIADSTASILITFTEDIAPPNVTLTAPPDNTINTTSYNQSFRYNVTDHSAVDNCSLIINGTTNQTDFSINRTGIGLDYINEFNLTLYNGFYQWYVNCTDNAGNVVNSTEIHDLTINLSNSPPFFTVETDDASTEADPTNLNENVTLTATANDPDLDSWFLLICNSSTLLANVSCAETQICRSPFTTFGTQALCSHNTSGESFHFRDWFSFACDSENCSLPNATNSPYIVNHHPQSIPLPIVVFEEDSFNDSINLSTFFTDPDNNSLNYTVLTELNITVIIDNATDIANFTADPNFTGIRNVSFTAYDPFGLINFSGNVTVNVTPINDAPDLFAPDNETFEDTPFPENFTDLIAYSSDIDNLTTDLIFNLISQTNSPLIDCYLIAGRYINCSAPTANFTGSNVLNISVSDGEFTRYDLVNITVVPVNDQPSFNLTIENQTWPEDTLNDTIFLLAHFFDIDNDTLNFTATFIQNISTEINQTSGQVIFTPDLNFEGIRTVVFNGSDGNLFTLSNNVTLNVTPVNDAPILDVLIENLTWPEDTLNDTVFLIDHFFDVDNDTLNFTATFVSNVSVEINQTSGQVIFTPDANFTGIRYVIFNATDGVFTNFSNNVTLNITPVNDEPVFNQTIENLTWPEDTINDTVFLLSHYFDIDGGDTLNFTASLIPNISVEINQTSGQVFLTPDANFTGIRYVVFNASDGDLFLLSNNVTLNVTNVNDPPSIEPEIGNFTLEESQNFTFDVNATDIDPTNDTLTFSDNSSFFNIDNVTGIINFTTNTSLIGTHAINISVEDGRGGWDWEIIQIIISDTFSTLTFNVTDRIHRIPLGNVTLTTNVSPCIGGCSFNESITIQVENTYINFTFTKGGFSDNLTLLNVTSDGTHNITMDDIEDPVIISLNITPELTGGGTEFLINLLSNVTDNFILNNVSILYNISNGITDNGTLNMTFNDTSGFWYGQLGPFNQTFYFRSATFANDTYDNNVLEQNDNFWFIFVPGANVTPVVDSSPNITLVSPDGSNELVNMTFTYTPSDDYNLTNCSLWVNTTGTWHLNQTDFVVENDTSNYFNLTGLSVGSYVWNVQCYDNASQSAFADNNFTFTVGLNNLPTAPSVNLTPDIADTTDNLFCEITNASTDADNDSINYTYLFYLNSTLNLTFGPTPDLNFTLGSGNTTRGDIWNCTVVPFDGSSNGTVGSDVVTLGDALAQAPTIDLTPNDPEEDDDLLCNITALAIDPDGDSINYTFEWYRDSVHFFSTGYTNATFDIMNSTNTTDDDDDEEVWLCNVTPFSNGANGTHATDTVTIGEEAAPSPGGGGGGGGGGDTCYVEWDCSEWGPCSITQRQTRTCNLTRQRGRCDPEDLLPPPTVQPCFYPVPPPRPRPPRPPVVVEPEILYLGNYDINDSYRELFDELEDWIYTYEGINSTVTVFAINRNSVEIGINQIEKIFSVDVGGTRLIDLEEDGVFDFVYEPHRIINGEVDMTISLYKGPILEVPRPRVITFLDCILFMLVFLFLAFLLYLLLFWAEEKRRRELEEALIAYIEIAFSRSLTREQIRDKLLSFGWERIDVCLGLHIVERRIFYAMKKFVYKLMWNDCDIEDMKQVVAKKYTFKYASILYNRLLDRRTTYKKILRLALKHHMPLTMIKELIRTRGEEKKIWEIFYKLKEKHNLHGKRHIRRGITGFNIREIKGILRRVKSEAMFMKKSFDEHFDDQERIRKLIMRALKEGVDNVYLEDMCSSRFTEEDIERYVPIAIVKTKENRRILKRAFQRKLPFEKIQEIAKDAADGQEVRFVFNRMRKGEY